ncbi:MAG: hypothetical protein KF758_14425 [Anaerolineales bacterium]|nr:hypothetical protein [Anaerolineales bacterium]MBX3038104.1 hypothetical protein [Anaerolineales bacterium]
MKIFIGLTDVANVTDNYAKGFRALGHEVFTVVWSKSRFYPDVEYDLVIDTGSSALSGFKRYLNILVNLLKIVKGLKCDLFILYAPAVLPTYLYYPILKLLGKKIITAFWGSDVRYWYAFAQEMKQLGAEDEVYPFFDYARTRSGGSYWDKLRTIKTAEKYSDFIISQPDCAQLQTKPYMRCNLPIDLAQFEFKIHGRERPLILHAPSVPEAKGTDVVMKVIDELKEEGLQFDFRLIQNMPNTELLALLAESDIVVDELYAATVGGLSAEAMASGNAVLVRYMEEYCKVPKGCPAINTNKFTLKENLLEMILNIEKRKQITSLGRPYVELANDHVKICKTLLAWLENKNKLEYDFYPEFYKTFSIPTEILKNEKREANKKRNDFYKMLFFGGKSNA